MENAERRQGEKMEMVDIFKNCNDELVAWDAFKKNWDKAFNGRVGDNVGLPTPEFIQHQAIGVREGLKGLSSLLGAKKAERMAEEDIVTEEGAAKMAQEIIEIYKSLVSIKELEVEKGSLNDIAEAIVRALVKPQEASLIYHTLHDLLQEEKKAKFSGFVSQKEAIGIANRFCSALMHLSWAFQESQEK